MTDSPILEVRGLEKRFGAVVAATEINVEVRPRDRIGIIGTNGAGKTTFVNMVTGYLKPSSGEIRFEGRAVTGRPPREVTRLGICRSFQVPQVFGTRTVIENLVTAMALAEQTGLALFSDPWSQERVARARRTLAEYGIAEHADREAGLVSQGVRKLLDIAMAMAHRPKILLLDEPTSGVSQEEKHAIMAIIMEALEREGVTVLFVEHDMDIVARYAQRVLAFMEGRIIADGPPEAALSHPKVLEVIVGEGSFSGPRSVGGEGHVHA